jgi:nondiscriminating aspartyl-tRNA synthetase
MDEYKYVQLDKLTSEHIDQKILVSGRAHRVKKAGSSLCFVILRDRIVTLQCVAHKKEFEKIKELYGVSHESYINLYGVLKRLPDEIKQVEATYYHHFELQILDYELVSKAQELAFSIDEANTIKEIEDRSNVHLPTKLNDRWLDLRTPLNNCIFRMQSNIVQLFREYLLNNDFMEIHSPKIIGTASESGANVFNINYFDKVAFLAQSPQLYKQMCINSDFNRVFEIGPVFRAENSVSHRHLCEFTGLDIEMGLSPDKNYYEVIDMLWGTLVHIFNGLREKHVEQYNYIKDKHSFEPLVYSEKPLIINFIDGVKMLEDVGFKQDPFEDLSTENERVLGKLVKEKYGMDIFVLDKYPSKVRPFYTMQSEDKNYSNSYDVIMRGEEIISGSQRVHDYDTLVAKLDELKINKEHLSDYLKSFKNGSRPHGGAGFGLERILMLYFQLENVRRTSLYPRDPSRLTP